MGWKLGTTFKRKTESTGAGYGTWVDALNPRLHRGVIVRCTKTLRSRSAEMKKLSHEDVKDRVIDSSSAGPLS